jgi:hypothetical protein
MRLTTETIVRGELVRLELTERDFCPECCGTLTVVRARGRDCLQCTSCYLTFTPNSEAKCTN